MPGIKIELKKGSKNRFRKALLLCIVLVLGLLDGIRTFFEDLAEGPEESYPWQGQLAYEEVVTLHNDGLIQLLPIPHLYGQHSQMLNEIYKDIMPRPNLWGPAFFLCALLSIVLSFIIRWWVFIPGFILAIIIFKYSARLYDRDICETFLKHEVYYQHLLRLGILSYRLPGGQSLAELAEEKGFKLQDPLSEPQDDETAAERE